VALEKFLIDKSALGRVGHPEVAARWADIFAAGRVAICPVLELEWLYSARSPAEYELWSRKLHDSFPWVPAPDNVWFRAVEVQNSLGAVGKHRGAGVPDLLLAATAEAHRLTVLHYDADYEAIAEITGQPIEWIAPRGSI
jgi:predicted nucleic acid-binding protein